MAEATVEEPKIEFVKGTPHLEQMARYSSILEAVGFVFHRADFVQRSTTRNVKREVKMTYFNLFSSI